MSEPTKTVSLWIELIPGWQEYHSIIPFIMGEPPQYTVTNGSKLVRVILDLPEVPKQGAEIIVAKVEDVRT